MEDKSTTIVTSLIRIFLKKILELEESDENFEVENFKISKRLRWIIRNFIWDKSYRTDKLIEQEIAKGRQPWQYTGYDCSACKASLVAYGVHMIS